MLKKDNINLGVVVVLRNIEMGFMYLWEDMIYDR